jgi:hypothetical protein
MEPFPTFAVQAAGAASVLIGLGHIGFGRFFGWGPELRKLPTVTARVFMTFHLALILVLTGLGGLTLLYAQDLSTQPGLPRALCALLALIWLWRLLWQVWYFRPAGRRYPTRQLVLHAGLILMFLVLAVGYATPLVATTS